MGSQERQWRPDPPHSSVLPASYLPLGCTTQMAKLPGCVLLARTRNVPAACPANASAASRREMPGDSQFGIRMPPPPPLASTDGGDADVVGSPDIDVLRWPSGP